MMTTTTTSANTNTTTEDLQPTAPASRSRNNNSSTVTIERAQPKMIIDSWQDKFMEAPLYFRIVLMHPDTCWLWLCSTPQPTFTSLSVAMNTKYSRTPLGTDIIGWEQSASSSESEGKQYAQRLAMHLRRKASEPNSHDIVFYVSYNLDSNQELRMFAERSMTQRLKKLISQQQQGSELLLPQQ